MKNKIKKSIILILMFLLIANVSALAILKPAKINENYTVLQTCSSCTYVNLSISNVDGIIVSNKAMINNGSGLWIYYFTPTQMSRHDVTGQGDLDGVDTSFATYFEVTPSGLISSTGDSILYSLFSGVLLCVISLLSFLVFTMPSSNIKDDRGWDKEIVKTKYLRVLFIFLIWPLTILLLNFLNGIATNYSALSFFSGILGFLFETMMRLTWPFTIIIIAWIIFMLVHDTNVKKVLDDWVDLDPLGG